MCRAVAEGGRRCVGSKQQYEERLNNLRGKIDRKHGRISSIETRLAKMTSPVRKRKLMAQLIEEQATMEKWLAYEKELNEHWDRSNFGLAELREALSKSSPLEPDYYPLLDRIKKAEKAQKEEELRRREQGTQNHNLTNVMRGEGYSEAEIEEMRQLAIEGWSHQLAPGQKTLEARFAKAQEQWDQYKKGGEKYEAHHEELRRIADRRTLSSDEKLARIEQAKAKYKHEKNLALTHWTNSRAKYEATTQGRRELAEKIEKVGSSNPALAAKLRFRLENAEKTYELTRRADTARNALKRRLTSLAKAYGKDEKKVWNALRHPNLVDMGGKPVSTPDPADARDHITVTITEKDYVAIRSDFERTGEYDKTAPPEAQHAAFQRFLSARASTTNFKGFHTAKTVVEANQKVVTGSTGRQGRNTTDASGLVRDRKIRVSLTQKHRNNLKALAGQLETTTSSVVRRLALAGREDLFAIQNDRSNDSHWKKMTKASQEHLGEEVTANFR